MDKHCTFAELMWRDLPACDRVARKPLFISMFCVFVTSPHQWDVFLYPDDCQEP